MIPKLNIIFAQTGELMLTRFKQGLEQGLRP